MPTHDRQLEVIQEAIRQGIDPANITPAQYARLRLAVRSVGEIVTDGIKAGTSKTLTSLGVRVSKEKVAANENTCRNCPSKKFRELVQVTIRDGQEVRGQKQPACDACNCSASMLISKWRDPFQECPVGHWTNRSEASPVGDAQRGA